MAMDLCPICNLMEEGVSTHLTSQDGTLQPDSRANTAREPTKKLWTRSSGKQFLPVYKKRHLKTLLLHSRTMPSISSLFALCFLSTFAILSAKAGPSESTRTPAHAVVSRRRVHRQCAADVVSDVGAVCETTSSQQSVRTRAIPRRVLSTGHRPIPRAVHSESHHHRPSRHRRRQQRRLHAPGIRRRQGHERPQQQSHLDEMHL
jgi:hypothetical protein